MTRESDGRNAESPRLALAHPGVQLPDWLLHPNLILGGAVTGAVVLLALLGLVWTPHDPFAIDVIGRFAAPGGEHWLGTDHFGRDILSLTMVGAWTSLSVAALAVAVGLVGGVPLGLVAAVRGGVTDDAASRLIDLVFAFPAILSAVLITALTGPGAVNAILAIGIFNIAVFARVTRAAALQVLRRDFVRAAVALGRRRRAVVLVHVLPNAAAPLIVQATVQFAVAILAEAALAYLGLGTQPPQPSLGKMLLDAQSYMFVDPMQAVYPGVTIAVLVLGLNLLGDGLRDALDPRLRVLRTG